MTTELTYLALVTLLTALGWIPYILNSFVVRGIMETLGYPENPAPLSAWAQRAKSAHDNATANLPVFAATVLVLHLAGMNNALTATAAMIYFWARLVHFVVFVARIPVLRTLSFLLGFGCQIVMLMQLF